MPVTLKDYKFKEEKDLDSPGFPESIKKFKLTWEKYFASIEEPYFFVLSTLRDSFGWKDVDKIKDIFSASETSAFYGSLGSRLSIAQDRVSHYSSSIGKFMQELFKMAQELRKIEERIELSQLADKGDRAADRTLKGIWTDLVEGGTKNALSVMGLSREAGFTVLPDLFFNTYIKTDKDVHDVVENLKFNKTIKTVLARKLKSYMVWKKHITRELINRKTFMKKHIKQYFLTIKMYINWLRPYLTHIKRLGMDESTLASPDLVAGFETSMTELEILFKKKTKPGNFYSIILVHFLFKTQPRMEFHQDGYQHRGPIHVGRVQMTFRGYVWTKKQIDDYKKLRKLEDFELLATINAELNTALNTLGDDIKDYLLEIGEKVEEDTVKLMRKYNIDQAEFSRWETSFENAKKQGYDSSFETYLKQNKSKKTEKLQVFSIFDPFKHLINGFSELTTGRELFKFKEEIEIKPKKPTKAELWNKKKEKKAAEKDLLGPLWEVYKIFKKAHGMLSW